MSKVGSWSTTPGNNNSTPPDGWPEGQAPSTVNDCAREMMASIKTMVNALEYIDLNNTPSFLTATTFSMATADVTNFVVGRRVKLFDANVLYGTIISVSAAQVQVRLDFNAAQTDLTSSLSSIAMAVVRPDNSSVPDNVWKRKNLIINGSMDLWQRSASFQIANNVQTYTADRFSFNQSSVAAVNVSRAERSAAASNVPTIAQSGVLFNNSLRVIVSAVDAAVAAGEFALIEYYVEGGDWRQIAHKPINLSFWANTNKSGIYAVALRSTNSSASFVANYTISTVNTWQRFSVPIPEAPTAPFTWDYSFGIGLRIGFALAMGATRQGGAGNWTATSIFATASQVNFLSSAGNVFYLTGVQLEEGQFATPLEIHPYEQELKAAKRYFQKSPPRLVGQCYTTQVGACLYAPEVEMRASPTVAFPTVANLQVTNAAGTIISVSAVQAAVVGTNQIIISIGVVGTPLVAGNIFQLLTLVSAISELDAEL